MMFRALRAMLRDPESKVLAVSALVVIAVGTLFYTWNEGWSPIQALYFCVVTLATVGYGDLHPTNELSQLFTIAYILSSVGIIAAFVTELAKHRPAPVRRQGASCTSSTRSWRRWRRRSGKP